MRCFNTKVEDFDVDFIIVIPISDVSYEKWTKFASPKPAWRTAARPTLPDENGLRRGT